MYHVLEERKHSHVEKTLLKDGTGLLEKPVMPLASMVRFLFMTGPFEQVSEVIDELPEPIETDRTVYEQPRAQLREYLDILAGLERLKEGSFECPPVSDAEDNPVDEATAAAALIQQQILERELEKINSLLCGPCGCTLCCSGPEQSMEHEFFEIPLAPDEVDLFPSARVDSEESRTRQAYDDGEFRVQGRPFYRTAEPVLIHWRSGWSLILPRNSTCPNLTGRGQCRVYGDRPTVCRRPQLFAYMVELLDKGSGTPRRRIRESLLAVVDCPYVRELQDEIAAYAAASELHLVLKRNKQ